VTGPERTNRKTEQPEIQASCTVSQVINLMHRLDSLLTAELLPTYANVKQRISNDPNGVLELVQDNQLSMVVEVNCGALLKSPLLLKTTENSIGFLSHIPFVHLIFKDLPDILLADKIEELNGDRVLTTVYRTSNDNHLQHSCCMTYDSFNKYLTDRDPQSNDPIWALINLSRKVSDKSILCSHVSKDDLDWRVDKLCKEYIRIDINKEILYSPDENSEETM